MTPACNIDDCEKDIFTDKKECILHSKKKDYGYEYPKNTLNYFSEALVEHIADYIHRNSFNQSINRRHVIDYLSNKDNDIPDDVVRHINNQEIFLRSIFFPDRKSRDFIDYFKVLNKFKGIHFQNCKFSLTSVEDLKDVALFFDECEFHQSWDINSSKVLSNVNNVLYQDCMFKQHVYVVSYKEHKEKINIQLFRNCEFKKNLYFEKVFLEKPIFNNEDDTKINANTIKISDCLFEDKFILNNLVSDNLLIENSIFNKKTELKYSRIKDAQLNNTNFKGLFDGFDSQYGNFNSFKCIFSDFVGFENCKFGVPNDDDVRISQFKYVTFLSFINFRNSVFNQGIDLEHTNLKEIPNFLNVTLLSKNTNRESLRIIKYSFDEKSNHIESNKFFALEMRQYRRELKEKPLTQEKVLFNINRVISNFGQSYLLPVLWLIFLSIIHGLLIKGYESNLLYEIHPTLNPFFKMISNFLNETVSNIIPFQKSLKKGMEFVSLIFYVFYAILIWQTIVSVKRYTRSS